MQRIALLVMMALMPGQEAIKSIQFAGPDGAKPADLKEAAQALQKRCEEYGFKGFKAKLESDNRITLTCESALTDEARFRLKTLASIAAAKVEVRLDSPATPEERAKLEVGKDAPEGSEWVKDPEPEWVKECKLSSDPGCWWLLAKKPRIDVGVKWKSPKSGKGPREWVSGMIWVEKAPADVKPVEGFKGPNERFHNFDKASSKVLMELPPPQRGRLRLFVDGVCLDTGGVLYDAGWTGGKARWENVSAREDKIMGVCINNPSPVSLKAIEPGAK